MPIYLHTFIYPARAEWSPGHRDHMAHVAYRVSCLVLYRRCSLLGVRAVNGTERTPTLMELMFCWK